MQLADFCETIVDCEHKTAPIQDTGFPSIRTPNIGRGYFSLDNVNRVSEETYRLWTKRITPRPGDLIMAREAPVGNVAMIPEGLQPCLGQRTLLIRPDKGKIEPRYLVYLLIGDEVQATIRAMTNGVTVPHLNMHDVRALELPAVPALPVQRRIAGILAAYDDLIENNRRRIRILEEIARSIYREWFVKFRFPGHENVTRVGSPLGPIPQGWQMLNVEDVCECVTDGSHFSPRSVDSGLPMASAKDMQKWGLRLDTCRQISLEDFEVLKRNGCCPKKNDVLVAKDGSYLKHIFVMRDDLRVVLLSSIAILRPSKRINPHLLAATLAEDGNRERLKRYVTGAALPRIILRDFKCFQIVVPPEPIQVAWSRIAAPVAALCWNLVDQNSNLRRTRDLLLPRLLSGTLNLGDVGDADRYGDEAMEVESATKDACVRDVQTESPPESTAVARQPFDSIVVPSSTQNLNGRRSSAIDHSDRSDVLVVIRQVFSDRQPRSREHAIRDVAHALGYGRVGNRIQSVLHTDLLTAVRRGILENMGGELKLLFRLITDYDRDFLKQQFVAALGRSWIERDEAIQNFCRWMGFRRTGPIFDETARSLINGLLRETRIEADGPNLIRRNSRFN